MTEPTSTGHSRWLVMLDTAAGMHPKIVSADRLYIGEGGTLLFQNYGAGDEMDMVAVYAPGIWKVATEWAGELSE